MKKIILAFYMILTLSACDNIDNKSQMNDSSQIQIDSSRQNIPYNSIHNEEYELCYIVSIASGYNYDSLKKIGIESSAFLNYEFDTLDRYYNNIKKRIVLPNEYEDEMYAGEYFPRRDNGDFVSLEMQYAYIDTTIEKNGIEREKFFSDTLKMLVFANLYSDKASAIKLLNKLKTKFKDTKIITANIYMGCMH